MAITKVRASSIDLTTDTTQLSMAKGTTAQRPTGASSLSAEYLIVAGGGGGGGFGGGGGAGGLLTNTITIPSFTDIGVTIGTGGAGDPSGSPYANGTNGNNSLIVATGINTITAIGGGGGLQNNYGTPTPIDSIAQGGSSGGGGGGGIGAGSSGTAIPKVAQPVPSDFTAFGNNGGAQGNTGSGGGGGGGGAGSAGEAGGGNGLGDAGAGQPFTDFPGPVLSPLPTIPSPLATAIGPTGVFGGGGGGSLGTAFSTIATHPSVGGGGQGGARPGISSHPGQKDGFDGVDGTGGGGGGAGGPSPPASGGDGGNGIVIIRQATTQATASTMTLVSDTFTANSTPTTARIVVFAEIADDLNTDISASATRDNTTFDAITLTDTGYVSGSSGTKIFTGSTPLTGTASPQVQMRWKITGTSLTGGNKIHGVSLQWK